jgi:hypothetical protein
MKVRVTGARAQAGSGLAWRRMAGQWVSAKARFAELPVLRALRVLRVANYTQIA